MVSELMSVMLQGTAVQFLACQCSGGLVCSPQVPSLSVDPMLRSQLGLHRSTLGR
jgi:hypothetical protein